jgi:hypothetical protein
MDLRSPGHNPDAFTAIKNFLLFVFNELSVHRVVPEYLRQVQENGLRAGHRGALLLVPLNEPQDVFKVLAYLVGFQRR